MKLKNLKLFLIILFSILFISGCTVEYNVNISKDEKVEEEIKIAIENDVYKEYYDSYIQYFDVMYNAWTEELNISGYEKIYASDDKKAYATFKKTYTSIEQYLNNDLKNKIFIDESDGRNINLKSNNNASLDPNFYIESSKFTIKTDYKLEKTNATKEDIVKGEYIWDFNNKELGDIKFTIVDEENKIKEQFNGSNIFFISTIIIVIIIVVGLIILYFFIRMKKVNKI